MSYDDEDMPQAPTVLPRGWKPGDMLPPEEDSDVKALAWASNYGDAEPQSDNAERPAGGLLARAGLAEPGVGASAGTGDPSDDGIAQEGNVGEPQSPQEDDGTGAADGGSDNDSDPNGGSDAGAPAAKVATKVDPVLGPKAIYGETAGLYPKKKNSRGSAYDPTNWDTESQKQLHRARQIIAEVQTRNDVIKKSSPSGDNPIEQRQWKDAQDAAIAAGNVSPRDVDKMLIVQKNVGIQKPPASWKGWTLYERYGPFENVGGGDVPRGHQTYIEFYQRPKKK